MSEQDRNPNPLILPKEVEQIKAIESGVDELFNHPFFDMHDYRDSEYSINKDYHMVNMYKHPSSRRRNTMMMVRGLLHPGDIMLSMPDNETIEHDFAKVIANEQNDRIVGAAEGDLEILESYASNPHMSKEITAWRQLTVSDAGHEFRAAVAHLDDARLTRVEIITRFVLEGLEIASTKNQLAAGTYAGLAGDDINDIRQRRSEGNDLLLAEDQVVPENSIATTRPSLERLQLFARVINRLNSPESPYVK